MLPCIIIGFFLNNHPGAPTIPILFCYKTLHVSGIFSAHHQEFSAVHSTLISFTQVSDDRFQAESGWNCVLTEFYNRIKLGQLVHLVGYLKRNNGTGIYIQIFQYILGITPQATKLRLNSDLQLSVSKSSNVILQIILKFHQLNNMPVSLMQLV